MLRENDIIFLKEGTKVVCSYFPENCLYGNSKFSSNCIDQIVTIGFKYTNDQDVTVERKEVEGKIMKLLSEYKGLAPEPDIVKRFVAHQVKAPKPQLIYIAEGEYLVTSIIKYEGYIRVCCSTLDPNHDRPNVYFGFFQMLVGHQANHDLIEADRRLV